MIEQNINEIKLRISNICGRLNLNSDDIKLLAVTKTIPPERIKEALSFGIQEIGESKIQEAQAKFVQISEEILNIKKHFIGHLQTNKVKKAVESFDLIQSLDSWRLAVEIDKQAQKLGKIQDCLIELKISEEETKFGLVPEELDEFTEKVLSLKNIKVCGLMAMSPFFNDVGKTRPYFQKMKKIFDKVKVKLGQSFKVLSMGISNDFDIAIEEGSNMVRIGTLIFGERKNKRL